MNRCRGGQAGYSELWGWHYRGEKIIRVKVQASIFCDIKVINYWLLVILEVGVIFDTLVEGGGWKESMYE